MLRAFPALATGMGHFFAEFCFSLSQYSVFFLAVCVRSLATEKEGKEKLGISIFDDLHSEPPGKDFFCKRPNQMGENTQLDRRTISHAGDREERDGRHGEVKVPGDLGPGIELGKDRQRETLLTKVGPPVSPLSWSKWQTSGMGLALAESSC